MKVYVVLLLQVDDAYIEGIFSTREKADEKMKELGEAGPYGAYSMDVWEVDGKEVKEDAA